MVAIQIAALVANHLAVHQLTNTDNTFLLYHPGICLSSANQCIPDILDITGFVLDCSTIEPSLKQGQNNLEQSPRIQRYAAKPSCLAEAHTQISFDSPRKEIRAGPGIYLGATP